MLNRIFGKLMVATALLACLTGCKSRSIVGTWVQDHDEKLKHELSFYSDGTYVDTVYRFILAERIVIRGTYKYDGKSLTAKPKTANVENAGTYAEQRRREARLPKTILDPDIGKIEWISEQSFRFIPDKDPERAAIYRRKS